MSGIIVGYKRVSSIEQNLDRQDFGGMAIQKVYEEKISGSSKNRPQLQAMIDFVREGDTVIVHSIDRLARNLKDLQSIVEMLVSKKVSIKFHKENLLFDGESENPMNKLMLQMMGAFAEFERSMIRERQAEGIAKAKAKGKKMGRKPKLGRTEELLILEELKQATLETLKPLSKAQFAESKGISRATLYRIIDKHAKPIER